jgi:alpha-glucuronidase
VEQVEEMIKSWQNLQGLVEQEAYEHILDRLRGQLVDAQEWRDVINNYFYRKSGIPDEKNRKIY